MNFIRTQLSRFKSFRRSHFTLFVVIEQLIYIAIMTVMLFLTKVSEIGASVDKEEVVISSSYKYAYLDVTKFVWLIPLAVSIVCFIYSLVIIFIKDVLKKPIIARKASKPFLVLTIIAFFAGAVILTLFQTQRYVDAGVTLEYNHRLALSITLIAQTLIVLDAYVWKEEFGLESSYGSNDPVF